MKIALIPIDNRPICYDLVFDILSVNKNIELFMPDIKFLGGLKEPSNINKIFEFLENLKDVDCLIVALDTIAYGGLVSSRRCNDDFDLIKGRIEKFKSVTKNKVKEIYAFSSVMRISNNNINEEEKEYWSDWGKEIFNWSYNSHKSGNYYNATIPDEILNDYLETRKRNFEINKIYLSWAKEGFFKKLIFSKDDCAEFGLNIKEALELSEIIEKNKIYNAQIKTGADEIPLSLISSFISKNKNIKIKPVFIEDLSLNLISKYEDITIKDCVESQLKLAGVSIAQEDYDLLMLINNFKEEQGDLVLGQRVNYMDKNIIFPDTPYFIADVNNANGADNNLIKKLFENNFKNLFSYCGYNTSANTIGCAVLSAIIKFLSIKEGSFDIDAYKKLLFIRFLDDWAYQSNVRKFVRENGDFNNSLREKIPELNLYKDKISKFLDFYPSEIKYSLPWDRSFEIRIEIQ